MALDGHREHHEEGEKVVVSQTSGSGEGNRANERAGRAGPQEESAK